MPIVLDTVFVSVIDSLLADAAANAASGQNTQLKRWYLGDVALWSGDPLDIDAIGSAFSRETVGVAYSDLAVIERAFRVRHSSPIRSRAHATARRLGHGDSAGCVERVRGFVQGLLTDGQTSG